MNKVTIILVLLIIIGGGYFAYTKYMTDGEEKEVAINETIVTEKEKELVKDTIKKIAKLVVSGDLDGSKKYFEESDNQNTLNQISGSKEDAEYFLKSLADFSLRAYGTQDILDNKNAEWTKKVVNGQPIVFIDNLYTDEFKSQICRHSIAKVGDNWYWTGTKCQSR